MNEYQGAAAVKEIAAEEKSDMDTGLREKPVYDFFKRAFDIVSCLIASVLLLIPFLIISLVIMIKDGGSPIYLHKRLGRHGREFCVWKFRSMKAESGGLESVLSPEQLEEYRKEYKIRDDPRLIGYKSAGDGSRCFGAKLRRMSIDELPQIFFNVLIKGDMSVVGPRPILRSELEENYTPAEQRIFLSVKPGITGYWQAYARNKAGYSNRRRQEMELYYIKNRSALLDIRIMLRTVRTVLGRNGVR